MLTRITLAAGLLAAVSIARAETFSVDTAHAEIGFTVRHLMISDVNGSFNSFDGTAEYDIGEKSLKSIKGWIDAASIDTNNDKRDDHLKNEDFFNTSEYPKLQFESTSIEKVGEGRFIVNGNLTVLGVDRKVTLPVKVAGPIEDPWGNTRIGINSETTLNRRDLGITNSPATMIGDEVNVRINAEAIYTSDA